MGKMGALVPLREIRCEFTGWKRRFPRSTEKKEEEGTILLTQTELKHLELLAMADGGRE